ncbi:MAG: DUF721 domain-containing protein [Planctomycetota bacterium]
MSERKIGTIVSQLMSRRGYASVATDEGFRQSVATAVGGVLGDDLHIGKLRRGTLQIYAVDSVTIQELTFMKRRILDRLAADHPQARIQDVRFRLMRT